MTGSILYLSSLLKYKIRKSGAKLCQTGFAGTATPARESHVKAIQLVIDKYSKKLPHTLERRRPSKIQEKIEEALKKERQAKP